MKTQSLIGVLLAAMASGCATTARNPGGAGEVVQRGAVVTRGPAAVAVVRGPAVLHAYAQFAGGALYTAPAVAGDDRDCLTATGDRTAVRAERRLSLVVPAGEVACLATETRGAFELVWHAHRDDRPAQMVASAGL